MQSKGYLSAQLYTMLVSLLETQPDAPRAIPGPPGAAETPHAHVKTEDILPAFAAFLKRQGEGFNGLRLAQRLNVYRGNHLLMTIMSHCETLEKAVEKLARYHDIASDSIRLHWQRGADGAALLWTADLPVDAQAERILVEAAVAACVLMLRDITARQAQADAVRFAYPPPGDVRPYMEFFRCPVLFSQAETGIAFANAALRLPVAMADAQLLTVLEEYADGLLADTADGLKQRALRFAKERLSRGQDAGVRAAAESLGVSVRTLEKRLRAEGAAYRDIVTTAKREIAVQSLRKGRLALTDIAFLLGFSEQSAFNHAFKRWTGQSPRQFIKSQKTDSHT